MLAVILLLVAACATAAATPGGAADARPVTLWGGYGTPLVFERSANTLLVDDSDSNIVALSTVDGTSRWATVSTNDDYDAAEMVDSRRALVTSSDSGSGQVLAILSGDLVWRSPPRQRVAGAQRGLVVTWSSRGLRGWDLTGPSTEWRWTAPSGCSVERATTVASGSVAVLRCGADHRLAVIPDRPSKTRVAQQIPVPVDVGQLVPVGPFVVAAEATSFRIIRPDVPQQRFGVGTIVGGATDGNDAFITFMRGDDSFVQRLDQRTWTRELPNPVTLYPSRGRVVAISDTRDLPDLSIAYELDGKNGTVSGTRLLHGQPSGDQDASDANGTYAEWRPPGNGNNEVVSIDRYIHESQAVPYDAKLSFSPCQVARALTENESGPGIHALTAITRRRAEVSTASNSCVVSGTGNPPTTVTVEWVAGDPSTARHIVSWLNLATESWPVAGTGGGAVYDLSNGAYGCVPVNLAYRRLVINIQSCLKPGQVDAIARRATSAGQRIAVRTNTSATLPIALVGEGSFSK